MPQFHNQNRQQGGAQNQPLSLDPKYIQTLQDGYFDSSGNMKCELITTLAEQVARDLAFKGKVSTAQLRGFFGHVRAVERELEYSEFAVIIPSIQKLEPLAAYYVGRGSNQYEKNERKLLKQFIDLNVQCAQKGKREFKEGLVIHFQSVVAYHKFVSR